MSIKNMDQPGLHRELKGSVQKKLFLAVSDCFLVPKKCQSFNVKGGQLMTKCGLWHKQQGWVQIQKESMLSLAEEIKKKKSFNHLLLLLFFFSCKERMR